MPSPPLTTCASMWRAESAEGITGLGMRPGAGRKPRLTEQERALMTAMLAGMLWAPRLYGISALEDQQIAGLVMWIPGTTVYLLALTIVFFKWFGGEQTSEAERV